MTIVSCPECDGNVSTRAGACPHCGAPVEANANSAPSKSLTDRHESEMSGSRQIAENAQEQTTDSITVEEASHSHAQLSVRLQEALHQKHARSRLVPMHFGAGLAANLLVGLVCFLDAFGRESGPCFGDIELFGASTLALWLGVFSAAGRVSLAFVAWMFGAYGMNAAMKDSKLGDTHGFAWVVGFLGAIGAHAFYAVGRFIHRLITPDNDK